MCMAGINVDLTSLVPSSAYRSTAILYCCYEVGMAVFACIAVLGCNVLP